MNPFARKSAEPAPSTAVALYQPPAKPSAAQPAGALEREIRSVIWQHMGPDLARSAGLSLSDLIDWVSVARLSTFQVEAIARKIGILNTPVSGLDIIRQAMARLTQGQVPGWGAAGNRRRRLDTLGEEDALSLRHHAAVQAFIAGDNAALTLDEINEFIRHWRNGVDDAYYDPADDVLRKRDIATPLCTAYPPSAQCRPIEEIVGRNAVREGLGWAPPLYPRDPALPPPGPARLAPSPGWA